LLGGESMAVILIDSEKVFFMIENKADVLSGVKLHCLQNLRRSEHPRENARRKGAGLLERRGAHSSVKK